MEKEKAFQILSELAKNKYPMNNLGMEDYGYLMSEHEVECFSHTSLTNENVVRIKEVMDKLGKDLINLGKDYERFVMIIEYNSQNELMMNEMAPIHEFCEEFVKGKKLCWGLSQHDDIDRVKITLVASR